MCEIFLCIVLVVRGCVLPLGESIPSSLTERGVAAALLPLADSWMSMLKSPKDILRCVNTPDWLDCDSLNDREDKLLCNLCLGVIIVPLIDLGVDMAEISPLSDLADTIPLFRSLLALSNAEYIDLAVCTWLPGALFPCSLRFKISSWAFKSVAETFKNIFEK